MPAKYMAAARSSPASLHTSLCASYKSYVLNVLLEITTLFAGHSIALLNKIKLHLSTFAP